MIRPYAPKDCDALVCAWYAASKMAHPFLGEAFLDSERQQIIEHHLPAAETWVWEQNELVLGFISLIGNEVGAIFVDPAWARRGVGKALMDHARSIRGALEVEVFEENAIGRAFYRKYGFLEMARKSHEQTGRNLVRLSLAADQSL